MNGQEELLRCDWLPNEQDGAILAALDYQMKNVWILASFFFLWITL